MAQAAHLSRVVVTLQADGGGGRIRVVRVNKLLLNNEQHVTPKAFCT